MTALDLGQGSLFVTAHPQPDLRTFDVIIVAVSGGKDSTVMLHRVCSDAADAGVLDRVVAVHAVLHGHEWPGVEDLVRRQVARYGIPLEICTRLVDQHGRVDDINGTPDTIADYALRRGAWPDARNRWCTSDFKRSPIEKVITRHVKAARDRQRVRSPVRVLDCMGMRAEESSRRSKMVPFKVDVSNRARDQWTWLPVFDLTTTDVWDLHRLHGLEHHPIYDQGMTRLSCVGCVLAGTKSLVRSAQLAPDHWKTLVDVEIRTGHRFRNDISAAQIVELAATATAPVDASADRWSD